MSTEAQAVQGSHMQKEEPGRGQWLLDFLRTELTPYPGRLSLALRMVAAATLAMLVIQTAHLPLGALGGYFALVITREDLRTTGKQTLLSIAAFIAATVYIVLGVALFVASPVTHFLWVVGSFLLIFYAIRASANYGTVTGFAFLFSTAIPVWDAPGGTNGKLALTLYALFGVCIGSLSVLLVETVYRSFHAEDPVLAELADRLRVSAAMLNAAGNGRRPKEEARLFQYAAVGPGSLRRQLIRSNLAGDARARATAAVALCGHVVELCAAALDGIARGRVPDNGERRRLCFLAEVVEDQASAVRTLRSVAAVGASRLKRWTPVFGPAGMMPALPEIERSIAQLGGILDSFGSAAAQQARSDEADSQVPPPWPWTNVLFAQDAFTNREHLLFAMRGCLAATLCFLIYNGLNWPGINTSVTTCIVTALGTVGSSRQKQILRIAGAIVGGFLIALPAQVYILPHIDSITGFTLLFVGVSTFAAWLATASPKLSYVGLQIALAFYLVNLSEPYEQISLAIARDRVVGILLGLSMMWLIFDNFAAPRTATRVEQLLSSNLKRIGAYGRLIGEPALRDGRGVSEKMRQLRDEINDAFSQMNAQADVVMFEFGSERRAKLRARGRMLAMQPAMRSIFLLEIALSEVFADNADRDQAALRNFLARSERTLCAIAALNGDDIAQTLTQLRAALTAMQAETGVRRSSTGSLCADIADSLELLSHRAKEPSAAG